MIFTWCSRDHHIPASRSTINPRGTRGFHVVFTWFSRGVYGIKKFLPLDQQLTLERIFPQLFCLGQIPVFSKSRIFPLWTNPRYFPLWRNPSFIPLWTNPRYFPLWTNPRYFPLWTNPRYFPLLQNSVHFSKLPCF